uniref:Endonuclease/exonuclease/phosphatase domain-containing protein n=1 Tax=Cacopsylla melanoneura TaxID=428564 RepID=A0A8D8TEW1_9HEMI
MKNNLDFISLDIDIPPIELNFEYCAITSPSLDIAIVCVYRSNNPSSCFETFFAQLDLLLQKLCCFKYLIVCGDFNINLQSNTNEKTRLVNILKMFNMKPTITTPTRVTTETSTCIDNILINFPIKNVLNKQNNNIFNGIGDHQYAQIISFHTKPLNEVKKIFTRTYDPTKIENFNQALSNTNFNHIYTVQTTDEKMSAFYSIFLSILNQHFPYKLISTKSTNKKKWMTTGILISSAKKRSLFELSKNSINPSLHEYYRRYSKTLQRVVKAAKRLHSTNIIKNAPRHKKSKAVWEVVTSYSKPNKRRHVEHRVVHQDQEIRDPHQVATYFI